MLKGFDALIERPEVKPLTHNWIEGYEARRNVVVATLPAANEVAVEPVPQVPEPHSIQLEALAALENTRRDGFSAGMVVLATGLGKTWLSAFDSNRREFRKVLFVAHREEILTQAMETYRLCRPKARLGRYDGSRKDIEADILFASVQTLGRVAHLRHFVPDHFDYVVVDEFHHASAATYRKLINHFSPKFMLGLTATPDRMDGADLLALCQENLVFRCDAFEGIRAELLSTFSYHGVPDDVDYAQIPWRSTGFDEQALTRAVATQARAQNALEQHQRLGGSRTLAFCVSQRHADFMADYFASAGLRCAAVHSGSSSAPRASSLEALRDGELDALFAVDMFNEGVDVPAIDTVLMLRPTESSIIWMQQFGRGLRKAEGKERLQVIDYIGNHRTFLTKARTLLNCSEGDRALAIKLEEVVEGRAEFPPGCEVTYELEAIEIMRRLIRPTARGDALEAFYLDFKLRFGERPTASETFHAGFDPRNSGHGGWFAFVGHQGDLIKAEETALTADGDFIELLIKTPMTRSYKMLLLRALRLENAFPGEIEIERLQQRFARLAAVNPIFRRDVSVPLNDERSLRSLLENQPIKAWVDTRTRSGKTPFHYEGGRLRSTLSSPPAVLGALLAMVDEVIDWRLATYLSRSGNLEKEAIKEAVGETASSYEPGLALGAQLWRDYMREEIAGLFGLTFSTGSWNQGFVVQGKDVFLLVTLDKSDLQQDHKYDDGFLTPDRFRWQSQNQTTQNSKHGQIIKQTIPGFRIHLFVRPTKKRGQTATPFTYCGEVDFESWEGERPITVIWALRHPVPEHFRRVLKVP